MAIVIDKAKQSNAIQYNTIQVKRAMFLSTNKRHSQLARLHVHIKLDVYNSDLALPFTWIRVSDAPL